MKKTIISTVLLILTGFVLLFAGSTNTASAQATFPTPTPNAEGYIVYRVQENDTLWNIAAITGVDIGVIRELNDLAEDDVIQPGKDLILGFVGPEATETPQPTAVIIEPTATIGQSTANICVLLYNDLNGDRMRQEDEPSVPGGVMSVLKGSDTPGDFSETYTTEEGLEHHCFEDVPIGTYNITIAYPDGYNPITVMNKEITLGGGDVHYANFGVQESKQNPVEGEGVIEEIIEDPAQSKSPWMGIAGAVLVLGGLGMGVFSIILARKK